MKRSQHFGDLYIFLLYLLPQTSASSTFPSFQITKEAEKASFFYSVSIRQQQTQKTYERHQSVYSAISAGYLYSFCLSSHVLSSLKALISCHEVYSTLATSSSHSIVGSQSFPCSLRDLYRKWNFPFATSSIVESISFLPLGMSCSSIRLQCSSVGNVSQLYIRLSMSTERIVFSTSQWRSICGTILIDISPLHYVFCYRTTILGSVKALPSLQTNSSATGAQSYLFILEEEKRLADGGLERPEGKDLSPKLGLGRHLQNGRFLTWLLTGILLWLFDCC